MSTPSAAVFEQEIGTRLRGKDLAGAAAAADACRRAWPALSTGWNLGSIVALLAGQAEAALALAEEWLAGHPADVQCLLQRAECLLALGRRQQATAAAEEAAAAAEGTPAALDAIGEFLVHAGDFPGAVTVYDRALRVNPSEIRLLGKRAELHRYLGNFDLAAADQEKVLELSPGNPDALKGLAELNRQSTDRNRVAEMEATLSKAAPQSKEAATLHFALAKSYEDLEEYAKSWQHLSAGNRLERAQIPYEPALDRAVFERIIAGFPEIEPEGSGSTGESPIFIVGLPRTGTTLVDRILGSHSAVHSAGELLALSGAISAVAEQAAAPEENGWLGLAATLPRLDPAAVAREYLQRARIYRGRKPRFTDKQLVNFYYCGVIARAFPRARILHLTRHPLAACHAIFKTRFFRAFPFSYDISELGDFYLDYRRLMAHWHRVLPGRILDVAYEDVVSALEPTTRKLLDYLDLPFEAQCLQFHRNPTPTATASSVQVRQPLYSSSIDRWKHYSRELAPLAARLAAAGIPLD
ncbi:MAG: sulfotransferase [Gammaproteobacteria bacterium]|nr:sulfotransferase [Gammaproteobacteria bacterium]